MLVGHFLRLFLHVIAKELHRLFEESFCRVFAHILFRKPMIDVRFQ